MRTGSPRAPARDGGAVTAIRARRVGSAAVATALAILAVPVLLAFIEGVAFHAGNRSSSVIVSSGQRREYLLHVPKGYDAARPTPLVISMHAAGLWPAAQRDISRWNDVADAHGFIVVYPSAERGVGPRVWDVEDPAGRAREARFISELIDTLSAQYDIDPARIFADGMSNGGGMAFVLSCMLPDRIAAVGLVSSAQTVPPGWCADPRPMPVIAFHGTADPVTPYRGGTSWLSGRAVFPDIPRWVARRAARNGCAPQTSDATVAADVTRHAYADCAGGADVVLYTIHGGGHTWPGGGRLPRWLLGPTSQGIDATRVMWAFFSGR